MKIEAMKGLEEGDLIRRRGVRKAPVYRVLEVDDDDIVHMATVDTTHTSTANLWEEVAKA